MACFSNAAFVAEDRNIVFSNALFAVFGGCSAHHSSGAMTEASGVQIVDVIEPLPVHYRTQFN
ncbi:hypothetical protein C7410_12933 [Paraburkholderia silvatlantica]|uniref:Uncharacterized protein n=1 Tax=Paraburkholderia silvatlantica TaxID=321895 RepID=A0A2V4T6G3_9BURK|nr:hypothetical protein C7410_12933 [Paraburkholderia silvatlantica]